MGFKQNKSIVIREAYLSIPMEKWWAREENELSQPLTLTANPTLHLKFLTGSFQEICDQ